MGHLLRRLADNLDPWSTNEVFVHVGGLSSKAESIRIVQRGLREYNRRNPGR